MRWRPGLHRVPRWGSLERSPDPLAGLRGFTSKGGGEGRSGKGREGRGGEGREGEGREGREGREERRGEEREGRGWEGRRGEGKAPPLLKS